MDSLIYLSYLCVKKRFLSSFYMLLIIFRHFQYCNITTDCYVRTLEEKKFEQMTLNFFITVHFHVCFKIFYTYDVISR
jgi:hypothetical protein